MDKNPFYRGQRVRIKKGCKITWTTHPQKKNLVFRDGLIFKRSVVIMLNRTYDSYYGFIGDASPRREAEIVWAGAGGYWFGTTDLDNVEAVGE